MPSENTEHRKLAAIRFTDMVGYIALALHGSLALARLLAVEPVDFLPPAPPWHGTSESLIARPDNPWITPAKASDPRSASAM